MLHESSAREPLERAAQGLVTDAPSLRQGLLAHEPAPEADEDELLGDLAVEVAGERAEPRAPWHRSARRP